jgi:hypothetical protein
MYRKRKSKQTFFCKQTRLAIKDHQFFEPNAHSLYGSSTEYKLQIYYLKKQGQVQCFLLLFEIRVFLSVSRHITWALLGY